MTILEFRTRFPEFTDVLYPDPKVQLAIDDAAPFFNEDAWGDMLGIGMACYVAHNLILGKANAKTPIVDDASNKKVGEISKTRSEQLMVKFTENPYLRTNYGQRYQQLAKLAGAGAISV